MFKMHLLSLLSLVLAGVGAFAAPQSSSAPTTCNGGGSIDCCTTTYEPDSYEATVLTTALNLDKSNLPEGQIATSCGGGGVNVGGGSTCENIPVCCTDNYFGLIGVGCSPIPVSL
ncbi:hypothetical protein BKA93DRAFT_748696 [Sparassis latifolia]